MCQLNIEQVRIDQVSFKHLTIEQNCSVVICSIIICSIIISSNSISSEGMQGNYYILQNSWFGSIVAWIIVVWIRGENRQGMTASRNTILRCGLDQAKQLFSYLFS